VANYRSGKVAAVGDRVVVPCTVSAIVGDTLTLTPDQAGNVASIAASTGQVVHGEGPGKGHQSKPDAPATGS
jgi:hypothetical protein